MERPNLGVTLDDVTPPLLGQLDRPPIEILDRGPNRHAADHRKLGLVTNGALRPPAGRLALTVGISPYIRCLREQVGHDLVLLPSVAVLVWDEEGRLLLVREAETSLWQTIGGAIEPDESPTEAAIREADEEAGVVVELAGIRGVVGGPQFRMTYPNGDLVSYVPTIFDAHIIDGEPHPDGEETIDVAWFTTGQLADAALSEFTVALLGDPAVAILTAR